MAKPRLSELRVWANYCLHLLTLTLTLYNVWNIGSWFVGWNCRIPLCASTSGMPLKCIFIYTENCTLSIIIMRMVIISLWSVKNNYCLDNCKKYKLKFIPLMSTAKKQKWKILFKHLCIWCYISFTSPCFYIFIFCFL